LTFVATRTGVSFEEVAGTVWSYKLITTGGIKNGYYQGSLSV
jgi:hypothetical protein